MSRRHWLFLAFGLALAAALVAGWRLLDLIGPKPFPLFQDGDGVSDDLATDVKLMWRTKALEGDAGPNAGTNPKASTDDAIKAASKVFNTVNLDGKTREEVVALLGDPKTSNDSIYNFPFWPAPRGSMVYRFDCGSYGWQFNVIFGLRGCVTEVRRHWIH